MGIYEEKLQKDIASIKTEMATLGDMIKTAVDNSVQALFQKDEKLANLTVLGDFPINRQCAAIHKHCHNFIARHLPSAGHLRMITSVIQMVMELERMGDYARTISREAIHLQSPPEGIIRRDLETMASHVQSTLTKTLAAFTNNNADLARATMVEAAGVSIDLDVAFNDLLSGCEQGGGQEKVRHILDLQSVAYMLERISNRATNVCEETVFFLTGEAKAERTHEIVFLDGDNSTLGPMAEVIARKGYANFAHFRSAGKQPADQLNADMVDFMRRHGFSMQGLAPKGLDVITPDIAKVHVLVSLEGPTRQLGLEIPFRTAFLDWEIGQSAGSDPNRYEEIHRRLSANIRQLMEVLHGEEGV